MTGRMPPSASRLQPVHNSAVRPGETIRPRAISYAVVLLHQIVAELHQKTTNNSSCRITAWKWGVQRGRKIVGGDCGL